MAWQEAIAQSATIPRFGGWARLYARYRPTYPAALIGRLAAASEGRSVCIELGAGTGQATEALLALYDRVVAVEPDAAMGAQIARHPRLQVKEKRAEEALLPAQGADVVAAFTALHWMDVDAVLARSAQWLCPGGVFFACGLAPVQFPGVSSAAAEVLRRYGRGFRGHMHQRLSSWDATVASVAAHTAFEKAETFEIYADFEWTPRQAAGFMMTTSFGQAYAQASGDADDAFETMTDDLAQATNGASLTARAPIEGVVARRRR
jgi:SAM-dependent methyltransferase